MKYNQKSDIWSLGCVLYKLMTFKYPFQADSNITKYVDSGALMVKVLTHKIPPILGNYSQELKDLATEMLSV
jgi:NIMA (never in mitosis gene a)-related kinase